MPLENPNVIDMLFEEGDGLVLVVTDSGATADPAERLALLRAKLATYAAALGEGRLEAKHRGRSRHARIEIVCAEPATPEMERLAAVDVQSAAGAWLVPVTFRVHRPAWL